MAYSKENINKITDYIFSEIEKGRALRNILKDKDMPSPATFYLWIEEDENKLKRYTRATTIRADIIFDDIINIADENINDTYINDDGKEVVNNDVIQRSRLRIDARKWVLGKLNPKKYGDKTDITSGGEKIQNNLPIKIEIVKADESDNGL